MGTEEAARGQDDRSVFDRFVEATQGFVSRGPFFLLCAGIVVAWLVSVPFWPDLKSWQVAIHTVASVQSLFLLALLENAGRRTEEASQEKLNVLAEAIADLMESRARDDEHLAESVTRLREAVGLEDRH
ncbi:MULTISPECIES: low affinity iron permease family protein [unclassified Aeromicrobium]|jgi:low affinity Fe/Cu permease|uniref:low affinity iron permease family protein n=1 Tax=unclassified Aeromicrobium TaxID=2633570 RepID=UPI0020977438|nr:MULTISPECIES: low affinity iron permease family protein [unclassified Aeromicrobium]MCO7238739.1 low affinity iron permease family protein [Aeromicrobium sp. CnD17-E]MDR6119523.1 low affinity Fe/Cu permease [Aeromicrobium sp. SORGH_AS_0981]